MVPPWIAESLWIRPGRDWTSLEDRCHVSGWATTSLLLAHAYLDSPGPSPIQVPEIDSSG